MASLISAPSAFARVPHLRDYQAATAMGLLAGIAADRGATFTVMFPRQAGKNEVAAVVVACLLSIPRSNGWHGRGLRANAVSAGGDQRTTVAADAVV